MIRYLLIILIILFPSYALGALGKYSDPADRSKRSVILNTTGHETPYAFFADGPDGVGALDLSSGTLADSYDISPGSMSAMDLVSFDGNIIVVGSRLGAPSYTLAQFQDSFDDGDSDLTDGSTGDSTNGEGGLDAIGDATGNGRGHGWVAGADGSDSTLVGNETTIVKHGTYSAKSHVTVANSQDYAKQAITGAVDNYVSFWFYVSSDNTMTTGQEFSLNVLKKGGLTSCGFRVQDDADDGDEFNIRAIAFDSTGTRHHISGTTDLSYDTWYQVKIYYKVDATTGGAQIWYRENYADPWTSEASDFTLDTSGKTPDTITVGINWSDWAPITVYWDEFYYNTSVDSNNNITGSQDDGYIGLVDATDPTSLTVSGMSGIYLEAKVSGLYAVSDDLLLVACQQRGLILIDTSDNSNIQFISQFWKQTTPPSTYPASNDAQGVTYISPYAIVANYTRGVMTVDISTPSSPAIGDWWDYSSSVLGCWDIIPYTSGGTTYLIGTTMATTATKTSPPSVADNSGIIVFDATDLTDLSSGYIGNFRLPYQYLLNYPIGAVGDAAPAKIDIYGNYVYAAGGLNGIDIWDISNPEDPEFRRSYKYSGDDEFIKGVAVNEDYVIGVSITLDNEDPDIYWYDVYTGGDSYYVDADAADDSGAGTMADPWKTISKVESGASAGDTIYFQRGDTWTDQLDVKTGQTFDTYGTGDLPVIDGENTRARCIYGDGEDNVTINNLKLKDASTDMVLNIHGKNWEMNSCTLQNSLGWDCQADGYQCNITDGADYYGLTIDKCTFTDICGWNNINIYSGHVDSYWYNLTITNNSITQSTRHINQANSECTGVGTPSACCTGDGEGDCDETDCVGDGDPFTCCTGSGTGVCAKHVTRGINTALANGARTNNQIPCGWTISNNYFEGLSGGAIRIRTGDTLSNLISSNSVIDCSDFNQLQIHYSRNLTIEDNTVSGSWDQYDPDYGDGTGIIIDFDTDEGGGEIEWISDGVVVRRNTISGRVFGPSRNGIGIWAGKNIKIYSNLCYNNYSGIRVGAYDECINNKVYNNTCVNNTYCGISVYGSAGETQPVVDIKNNILYGSQYGIRIYRAGTPTISHNCYYNNSSYDRWDALALATFDAGNGAISLNPLFVSSTDYHLRLFSPCKNAGLFDSSDPYSEIIYDLDSRQMTKADGTEYYPNSKPIGAYMYWPSSVGGTAQSGPTYKNASRK